MLVILRVMVIVDVLLISVFDIDICVAIGIYIAIIS